MVNLIAVLMLFPVAMRVVDDFRKQLKAGNDMPVFNADDFKDLNIDKEAWTLK